MGIITKKCKYIYPVPHTIFLRIISSYLMYDAVLIESGFLTLSMMERQTPPYHLPVQSFGWCISPYHLPDQSFGYGA